MASLCKCVANWGCLPTGQDVGEKSDRNLRIKYGVGSAFVALAAVALAIGVSAFTGRLCGAASVLSQNALWVTVGGGIALALALIAYCGTRYHGHQQEA
ncbi:MAG: hypothetical protein S4CHLAM81_13500 [Chlamydiales bacterium]|nr:hypothetical protein [Chlamydiales bacterium]MCH9636122.1 hypothetical protein [Chlamydiales bacterium]MCH9703270.1 hypothetical protein [Chlamydiota bacterium]